MSKKTIIYYLLAAFIAGNLLLIYIQYNSAKNINTLIKGNEKVLAEINVTANLRELNRDISSMEVKPGTSLSSKESSGQQELDAKISKMRSEIDNLQKISDDDSSVKYIDVLDILIQKKMSLRETAIFTDDKHPDSEAEKSRLYGKSKQLNDSIRVVTHLIENSRQKLLLQTTSLIDKSGKNALNLGTALIILVLAGGTILFWFIVSAILKQNKLIEQLNISERNVKESARVKEKFMANMSHEIRTPMNAILGFTNLLQHKKLDEDANEYVAAIHHSGETLLAIINDILDLSKIEAGMMRIESAPFSVRGLIHSIETMFKTKVAEKSLTFSIAVNDKVPDILEGDSMRLTQILVNLVGNAIKFTSEGTISVMISNEGVADNVMQTGITVTDTGIGIEKEKLKYIFERFQQAEDSVTRKFGGTGLGLSIIDDLIKLQNGKIQVESEPGKGTAFRLLIPYKISAGNIYEKPALENDLKPRDEFVNNLILVVEDHEVNKILIKHLFKNWQLKFDMANNGIEAIEMLRSKTYDLILMDIQMPGMDGYSATGQIRNKLKLDTPIIAMTAHALAGEKEKCLSYGMNEYISKPIREEQLHNLIVKFTKNTSSPGLKKAAVSNTSQTEYNYIDLHYMKEVSGGNTEYEKTVTAQFIEAIPDDLLAIELAWRDKDIKQIRQLVHYIRATVSVMGLDDKLQPCMDVLEYENINPDTYNTNFPILKNVCLASLQEAKHFYSTI